ncbi:amino acid ABC transporter permease [Rouxiella badensis]|jgi:polar amino acid transport system permease protein|uniref:amino acid ABC transporter permease n=1 Tax=Rouxiella badensis TaxID=1646377 RepID=UPI0013EF5B3E|nr:amino acid ABC transporter permease [Rouxiella badensis]MCC3701971.1 amino acid ABC transporter permease [Rouxiella badensis]MCC3718129.1 amino acid ABC transporter permease [Rouxiella badensis]MCC3727103.1 amino acid ABC transporter permease [Rouxiella badensis]MCC3731613.1 amino acid ABC transporter permease [Rouxiella badensis]MCC3738548.1 amino acid ABC transporter permease [Rouxiella badensis]
MTDLRANTALKSPAVDLSEYHYVPRRYYGRIVASVIILALLALLINAFAHGKIEWRFVGQFLTARAILFGLGNTIVMSILAMALGVIFGVIIAVMRMSSNPVLSGVAIGYTWIFRGTPLILQLLLWFNLALIFPTIGIPGLFQLQTVDIMTPFSAALLGLSINQGAYTSEVVRAGLISVDLGQYEAAKSIGMTRLHALRRIILPQAMRVIIPPIGNEFISMVKTTSLASMIQYSELLYNAQTIYFANARVMELLFVAGIWYLVVVTLLSLGQNRLERYFGRGTRRRNR